MLNLLLARFYYFKVGRATDTFELIRVNRVDCSKALDESCYERIIQPSALFLNRSVVIELMIAVNKRRLPLAAARVYSTPLRLVDQLSSTGSRESAVASGKRLARSLLSIFARFLSSYGREVGITK